MINVKCSICDCIQYKPLYSYKCNAGKVLGIFEVKNVMCENCGFVYMNPRPNKSMINKHYKSQSSGNTFHEKGTDNRHSNLTNERKSFIELNLTDNHIKIIDIGCGQGQLLQSLRNIYLIKHGLDPSQKEFYDKENQINYFRGYFEDKNLIENDYDVVLCISSLEHYYNPSDAMKTFYNMLRNHGLLFLEIPNSLHPVSQISDFYSFEHLSHFTPYTISKLLELNNFEIIKVDSNVSIPNIRLLAKKVKNKIKNNFDDDRVQMEDAIKKYKSDRFNKLDKIKNKIIPLINKLKLSKKSIAVYGAGIHTNFLLDNFDIKNSISAFIDSDSSKWNTFFHDIKVYEPSKINSLEIDAILISSHDYEMEIFDSINSYNSKEIPVLKCYND